MQILGIHPLVHPGLSAAQRACPTAIVRLWSVNNTSDLFAQRIGEVPVTE